MTLVDNTDAILNNDIDDNLKKLNNCKNVENHKNSLRLVNNLGTSWTRRNAIMHKQKAQDFAQKCQINDQQLATSPWFQEGLSR